MPQVTVTHYDVCLHEGNAMNHNTERDAKVQKSKATRQASPEAVAILAAMMMRRVQRLMRERDAADALQRDTPPRF